MDKSLNTHNYKSTKNVELYAKSNKTNNNKDKKKKIPSKKANINELNKQDNNQLTNINEDSSIFKIEECKDSSNFLKNLIHKKESDGVILKSFNLNDKKTVESKIKKVNNKKKAVVVSTFQISKNVNNIFIFPHQENKNNIYQNHNQNMNILSPGNFISIEYNINHDKNKDRNLVNNNHNIINNNETNNLACFKKEIQIKNDDADTQNQYQRLKDNNEINNEINNNKNNELINSKDEINAQKKSKKKLCFCCL